MGEVQGAPSICHIAKALRKLLPNVPYFRSLLPPPAHPSLLFYSSGLLTFNLLPSFSADAEPAVSWRVELGEQSNAQQGLEALHVL